MGLEKILLTLLCREQFSSGDANLKLIHGMVLKTAKLWGGWKLDKSRKFHFVKEYSIGKRTGNETNEFRGFFLGISLCTHNFVHEFIIEMKLKSSYMIQTQKPWKYHVIEFPRIHSALVHKQEVLLPLEGYNPREKLRLDAEFYSTIPLQSVTQKNKFKHKMRFNK